MTKTVELEVAQATLSELIAGKNVELEVAQATLSELVAGLTVDDEVVIMKNHIPVAKLVAAPPSPAPRVPGLCKGMITIVAEDDDHLKDFEEYMP